MARGSLMSQFKVSDSGDTRLWTADVSDKLLEESVAMSMNLTSGDSTQTIDLGGLSGTGTRFLTVETDVEVEFFNNSTDRGLHVAGGGFLAAVVSNLATPKIEVIGSGTATIDVRIYEFTSTG